MFPFCSFSVPFSSTLYEWNLHRISFQWIPGFSFFKFFAIFRQFFHKFRYFGCFKQSTLRWSLFQRFRIDNKVYFRFKLFFHLLCSSVNSSLPSNIFADENCTVISSNATLSFQNINIVFAKTNLLDSPFKILNQSLLSIEVNKKT